MNLMILEQFTGCSASRLLETMTTEQYVSLSQASYIKSILRQFNFTNLKPFPTPMHPNIRYSKTQSLHTIEEAARMRQIPYHKAIGSILHLSVATQPDIAFATGLLSQFVDNPGWMDLERVK
jgi:hypothetical protein